MPIQLASLFLSCSIAMATKENMTSQRGMLKSIQSKMNTLASILFEWLRSVAVMRGNNLSVCFPPRAPRPPAGRSPSSVVAEAVPITQYRCTLHPLREGARCLVPFLKDCVPGVYYYQVAKKIINVNFQIVHKTILLFKSSHTIVRTPQYTLFLPKHHKVYTFPFFSVENKSVAGAQMGEKETDVAQMGCDCPRSVCIVTPWCRLNSRADSLPVRCDRYLSSPSSQVKLVLWTPPRNPAGQLISLPL